MRFLKSLLVFVAFFVTLSAIANSQTYDLDEFGIERVGLKELQNMSKVDFESGNYRLDPDFRLGYGDTVEINLWGKFEGSYELTIDRSGDIVVPLIGILKIAGLGMDGACNVIESAIDRKYSNVNFSFTLKDVKDIRIFVTGNANTPGPYAVSPFCKVIEALAKSGGPNENGSLCNIKVIRDGEVAAVFNLYNFLRKNDQSRNIRLKHGDTIYIPEVKALVIVKGDVRYPGIYEIEKQKKVSDLLDLAGGMLPTKFNRKSLLLRINPDNKLKEIFNEVIFSPEKGLDEKDNIVLENDDIVIISTEFNYTPRLESLYKTIYLKGEFVIPGDYLVDDKCTLYSLMKQAGGIKEDGFIEGAVYKKRVVRDTQKSMLDRLIRAQKRAILEEEIYITGSALIKEERLLRQRAIDLKKKALDLMAARVPDGRVIIDLKDIVTGKADMSIEDGDSIFIPTIANWVLISGAVYNPQSVFFKDGKNLDYYINITGGLTGLADSDNIYVIKANGSAQSKFTGIGVISRGDIIIVPEKME